MLHLLNLIPTLALVGMALTGLEQVPTALAHNVHARSPKDHHKHLAARQRLKEATHVKRGAGGLIKRKADGSKCRVRGQTGAFTASTASATATSATSIDPTYATGTTAVSTAAVTSSASDDWSQSATTSSSEVETTSSSSTAAPAATQSVTASGPSNGGWANAGSKFGLAWPNGNWASSTDSNYIGNYIGSKSSWYYTWSPFSVGSGDQLGLEFVPMLWGPAHVSDWWSQMYSWPSTVKNALFFNEPNQVGQCDIAAQQAVQYWMNHYLPVRHQKGVRLGGAAVTNAPSGLTWIQDFEKACTDAGNSASDCAMDFVPVHYYDTSVERFQQYVENFHQQTGLNIWVTEYACQDYNGGSQCSEQDTWTFHQQMAAWFDSQDYVERYSPFGVMKDMQGVNQDNALMNPDGSITSLGSWYISSA
ncbi:hypothetical protein IAU60_002300 [Kwoniella sp. DSM 27419]